MFSYSCVCEEDLKEVEVLLVGFGVLLALLLSNYFYRQRRRINQKLGDTGRAIKLDRVKRKNRRTALKVGQFDDYEADYDDQSFDQLRDENSVSRSNRVGNSNFIFILLI